MNVVLRAGDVLYNNGIVVSCDSSAMDNRIATANRPSLVVLALGVSDQVILALKPFRAFHAVMLP